MITNPKKLQQNYKQRLIRLNKGNFITRLFQQMTQNSARKKQKTQSYLPSHPQITKKVTVFNTHQKQKPSIPQKHYQKVKQQLYQAQQQLNLQLQSNINSLQHENQMFADSLAYFNPEIALQQLQRELQSIKQDESAISQQISNCQLIEQTTTPEEYFLFKKNKRLETFNQGMDALFDEVNREKEQMKKFMEQIRAETASVNGEIEDMEKQLYMRESESLNDNNSSHHSDQDSQILQSKVELTVESSHSDQNSNNNQQEYSDSGSSVDTTELQKLSQEYKNIKQTYDIIQQNNEIMSTQLINNIGTIEESLNKNYEAEKAKLFREIMQLKEDFQYMPIQHIIPPSETQLNYDVAPLIQDYKDKLKDISLKLSSDLKSVTLDLLEPLRWDTANFDEYIESPRGKQYRESKASIAESKKSGVKQLKAQKQAQLKYDKLQERLKKENEIIGQLQNDLQQVMGETMIYKQKQHELQLAMNNMRKMIREQQPVF